MRNDTADIALGHRGRRWPRCLFITTGLYASLSHVGLAHVDPDRVVYDPVHYGVGMYPAVEPRVPVLLLELGAEDGLGGLPCLSSSSLSNIELDSLSGLLSCHSLSRFLQYVLDAALRDVGYASDRVLRQAVHRLQPQDLPGPDPSRHVELHRSLKCMVARAQRRSRAGRIMKVPNCDIRSGGRRCCFVI